MKIIIVMAEGSGAMQQTVAKDDQTRQFIDAAIQLARWCIEASPQCQEKGAKLDCVFMLPDTCDEMFANIIKNCSSALQSIPKQVFKSGRELAASLKTGCLTTPRHLPPIIVMIGHGGPSATSTGSTAGLVDVIDKPISAPREFIIDTMDINDAKPSVYFGLHCFAGSFLASIDPYITGFALSADAPAQNAHIVDFTRDERKQNFVNFLIGITFTDALFREPDNDTDFLKDTFRESAVACLNGMKSANPNVASVKRGNPFT